MSNSGVNIMRYKNLILITALAVISGTAIAQTLGPTPAAGPFPPAAPVQPAKPSGAAVSGPGVVTMSDAATPAPVTVLPPGTAPRAGAIQPEAKAIVVLDGNGQPMADAKAKMDSMSKKSGPRELALIRISHSDDQKRAMMRIRGAHRYVVVGSQVGEMTVSEIRDDSVCLVLPSTKRKCAQLITFHNSKDEQ